MHFISLIIAVVAVGDMGVFFSFSFISIPGVHLTAIASMSIPLLCCKNRTTYNFSLRRCSLCSIDFFPYRISILISADKSSELKLKRWKRHQSHHQCVSPTAWIIIHPSCRDQWARHFDAFFVCLFTSHAYHIAWCIYLCIMCTTHITHLLVAIACNA